MKRISPLTSFSLSSSSHHTLLFSSSPLLRQSLHTTPSNSATPLPITATGPPPAAPIPAASQYGERVDRRRQQAALLNKGQDMRAGVGKPGAAMKKRFWKDVSVSTDNESNHLVNLDTRAVRNPTTKTPLVIPASKPQLATALALEWDLLTSAQQATRSYLIPLTSLASRAQALALEDAEDVHVSSRGEGVRYDIVNTLLRYLDTDTLLCWAPPPSPVDAAAAEGGQQKSLRELQVRTAKRIIAYLTTMLWPGIELRPTLDDVSILPKSQPAATRAVIKGWMSGLPAWELVGLERAVLAGKSVCVAARLVGEWSEQLRTEVRREARFGIEDAVEASSLEVRWQTGRWGEVEDSHDVDREDLRRQFGSVVLLISGTGRVGTA